MLDVVTEKVSGFVFWFSEVIEKLEEIHVRNLFVIISIIDVKR
jgi:hypothetical protein